MSIIVRTNSLTMVGILLLTSYIIHCNLSAALQLNILLRLLQLYVISSGRIIYQQYRILVYCRHYKYSNFNPRITADIIRHRKNCLQWYTTVCVEYSLINRLLNLICITSQQSAIYDIDIYITLCSVHCTLYIIHGTISQLVIHMFAEPVIKIALQI